MRHCVQKLGCYVTVVQDDGKATFGVFCPSWSKKNIVNLESAEMIYEGVARS